MGTLQEEVYTFMKNMTLNSFRMRNVSKKTCRENQNMYFTFNKILLQTCGL